MKRLRIVAVAATAVSLVLAGCSTPADDAGSGDKPPFRIVFIAGLTGGLQTPSQLALKSFEGAIDYLNDTGGIDGRQITIETGDSQSDPTRAVSLLQEKLASGDKPDLVFSGLSSGESLAMLPVLTRNKILSIGQSASPALNDPEKYPYNFGVSGDSFGQWVGLPDYLEENGAKKIVGLFPQDGYGDGGVAAVENILGGISGVDVAMERFNPQDIDFTVNWQKVKSQEPDMVIADCFGDACSRIFAGRVLAGATDIPVVTGSGPVTTGAGPVSYSTPDALDGVSFMLASFMEYKEPAERSGVFAAMYDSVSKDGPVESSLVPAVHPWDELLAVKLAYEATESDDVEEIVKQMYVIDEPAESWVSGWNMAFSEDSHFYKPEVGDYRFVPLGAIDSGMFSVAK